MDFPGQQNSAEIRVDATVLDTQVRQVLNDVIRQEYPEVEYQMILDIKNIDSLAEVVEIPAVTARGEAAWLSDEHGNVYPTVEVSVDVMRVKPKKFGIGVEYTEREAQLASRGVVNIIQEKTKTALLACEQFQDNAFMLGDTAQNIRGFLTHPFMNIVASDTVFEMATTAQDMYDALAALVADQNAAANHVKRLYADTLFLTERVYGVLTKKIINTTNGKSVLATFLENCATAGQPLKVMRLRWLTSAGFGGLERIGVGRLDAAEAYVAQRVDATPIEYRDEMYRQKYRARIAGVLVRYPLAFRWLEGTAP